MIELELSNRVQGAAVAAPSTGPLAAAQASAQKNTPLKVFVRAVVDINLALGTLLKNPMFEEAESEFQHLASFQTRITLRNALQVYVDCQLSVSDIESASNHSGKYVKVVITLFNSASLVYVLFFHHTLCVIWLLAKVSLFISIFNHQQ